MADRSAKRELSEPFVFRFAPRIESEPSDELGFVGDVCSNSASAVERSGPVLQDAAVNISVKCDAGATVGSHRTRVQHRLQTALNEVEVGSAYTCFLSERLFELASLELEFGLDPDVEIDIADDGAGC